MLARKMMKKEDPKTRATIFTIQHEFLEVATSATAADVDIPAGVQEEEISATEKKAQGRNHMKSPGRREKATGETRGDPQSNQQRSERLKCVAETIP